MEFLYRFNTPWPWWLIIAAGLGAGIFTLRGYRRRAAEITHSKLWFLRVLRTAAWVFLIVCLLQPIHRQVINEQRRSRIAVLVDTSESMSFKDSADGDPRIDRVRRALYGESGGKGLLARLAPSFEVKLETFDKKAVPIAEDALKTATPDGPRTDMALSLDEAHARLKGPDAGGLILISDGADTVRGDLQRVAQKFRRTGIPIYTLGVGATDFPDLAIQQVRCRRRVSKDTLVHVEVDVTRLGAPPGVYPVRILRDGREMKSADVDLTEEKATATFEFLPGEQGFLEYEARIDRLPGELVESNNALAFGLMAFNRKLRVLYMEGSLYQHGTYFRSSWQEKWEHEFLVDALEEDHDVEVDVLLRDKPDDYVGQLKSVKEGYPKSKKDLFAYDVIVCSDIPYNHFTDDQVKWTVDFVARHGGGFVMVGGWTSFGEGGYARSPMDRMLPVEMNAHDNHAHEIPTPWAVTDEGFRHPIMQIVPDPEKNKKVWAMLNVIGGTELYPKPAFNGFSKTTRPKPAATMLAYVDDENFESAYGPMVLLAVQSFGRGRSMAFTSDCTGGWGAAWEDAWGDNDRDPDRRNIYYKTFWKNAVRWLAEYRMQAPNQLVQLETDRLVYGRGELPKVSVTVVTQEYDPTDKAKVTLTVTAPGGEKRTYSVFPEYAEPGRYERKLELTEVGRHELEVRAELDGLELGTDKTVLQVRQSTEELRRLGQDVDALNLLAEESEGMYVPLERAQELGGHLRQDTHVILRHQDRDLWDRWWIFAAIVGLLCGEWFYRKRNGLP
ncbi:MAG: glutamine amidotransferase [Planctomycetes bacterium]|nr:glutamine amidotransferase [Planctomycetota bacterium]